MTVSALRGKHAWAVGWLVDAAAFAAAWSGAGVRATLAPLF